MLKRAAAFALSLLALSACTGREQAAAQPVATPTIISVNPCSDQLLEALGADDQIMAVSHWSHDPASASASPEWAAKFSATSGRVEDLVNERPDLVLSGGLMSLQQKEMLHRAEIEVLDFPVPSRIDQSLDQIRQLGNAIKRKSAANSLVSEIQTALAASASSGGEGKRALVITGSALTGDDTLIGNMLTYMGYYNAAGDYGVSNLENLRLEQLLASPPDLIFANPDSSLFHHPALEKLSQNIEIREFPQRLSWCAGPSMVAMAKAMERAE